MRTPPAPILVLQGAPHDLGRQHGAALRSQIHANVGALLAGFFRGTSSPLLEEIRAWQKRLRAFCFDHWPWLEDEIQGIAEGAGLDRTTAELLSFRAWQYEAYHAGACSSFALPGSDGKILAGGTLDDPRFLYAVAQVQPTAGLRYLSFPLAGTVWANRGMNEAGLALGLSSLLCPGVTFELGHLVPVDLVFRSMLQFCSTVAEVEAGCRKFHFFGNLVAVDRHGGVFASANYCGGMTTYPATDGIARLTNHPVEPAANALRARGFTGPDPGAFSTERLAQIDAWIAAQTRRASVRDAAEFLGGASQFGSVNNPNTAFATIAVPESDASVLWVAQQPVTADAFYAFDVKTGMRVR
ncbi:MAG: peptidase [Verrucomicrobia bacterium]|nr:peptidase [Verrucomicrobiota bacterium]